MSVVWLMVSFIAGVLFWHVLGNKLVKWTLGRDQWTRNVVQSLDHDRLVTLSTATTKEIERRKAGLA